MCAEGARGGHTPNGQALNIVTNTLGKTSSISLVANDKLSKMNALGTPWSYVHRFKDKTHTAEMQPAPERTEGRRGKSRTLPFYTSASETRLHISAKLQNTNTSEDIFTNRMDRNHVKKHQQLRTGVYLPPFRARGSSPRPAVRVVTIPSDSWNGTWVLRVVIWQGTEGQTKNTQRTNCAIKMY